MNIYRLIWHSDSVHTLDRSVRHCTSRQPPSTTWSLLTDSQPLRVVQPHWSRHQLGVCLSQRWERGQNDLSAPGDEERAAKRVVTCRPFPRLFPGTYVQGALCAGGKISPIHVHVHAVEHETLTMYFYPWTWDGSLLDRYTWQSSCRHNSPICILIEKGQLMDSSSIKRPDGISIRSIHRQPVCGCG